MKTKQNKQSKPTSLIIRPATLFRRFAALIYDTFIVFSFLLLATTFALIANKGEPLTAHQYSFLFYLIISTGIFLSWFWKKGQTLGMLAWKIKLVDEHMHPITMKRAFIRYLLAILSWTICGLGYIWCFFDKENQGLHDRIAKTRVIQFKFE